MKVSIRYFFKHRIKDRGFQIRTAWILGFLILLTLMMPRSFRLRFQHEVARTWQEDDLIAEYEFAIYQSPDSLEIQRDLAASQIPRIFERDSSRAQQSQLNLSQHWDNWEANLTSLQQAAARQDTVSLLSIKQGFFDQFYPDLSLNTLLALPVESWVGNLRKESSKLSQAIYRTGFLNASLMDSLGTYVALRHQSGEEIWVPTEQVIVTSAEFGNMVLEGSNSQQNMAAEILLNTLQRILEPNFYYNADLTQLVKDQQRKLVSPIKGKVNKGDIIIQKGEVIDRAKFEVLESLIQEEEKRFGEQSRGWTFFSQFLVITLICSILFAFLKNYTPRVFFDNQRLVLILVTILLTVGAMVISAKLIGIAEKMADILGPNVNLSYIYLAPACIVPIFMINFFGPRIAYMANLVVALLGGILIQQGLEFVFVQIMAGTLAVYSLRNLREREEFFLTLLLIFLAYCVSYIAFNLYSKGGWAEINYRTILLFGINMVFTVIGYNFIYLFEQVFGATSDLSLLELLDTNHPLLKEMHRKAPGTFQHSTQVANIAESVINEIGGNALLIHVAALYHDVGKMAHPGYFIENMSEEGKKANPHLKIPPEESARIIIGHVKEGVELAKKHHLPKEIIHFVETHHGTTRVEYFYRMWLENGGNPEEGDALFRYPGPRPFTKEMAVLMISDSMEAAARSIPHPTPEKIEMMVNKILDFKIKDGQLDDSNLTFRDISNIRKIVVQQLLSIHHARIEYPDTPEELVPETET
ncbi:MAG: HDIG domain-containing metalloprotein [Bacteroidota bacterium]